MGLGVLPAEVVGVVGADHGEARILVDAEDAPVHLRLVRDAVVLELQEIVAIAEDLQVAFCSRLRVLVETFFQASRDFTGKAGA